MATPRRGGGPSKNEVELARVESEHKVKMRWAYGVTRALCIALAFAPIYAFSLVVEPLAGNTTQIKFNFAFGATLGLSLAVNLGLVLKWRSERADLKRLRDRQTELEKEVGIEI